MKNCTDKMKLEKGNRGIIVFKNAEWTTLR